LIADYNSTAEDFDAAASGSPTRSPTRSSGRRTTPATASPPDPPNRKNDIVPLYSIMDNGTGGSVLVEADRPASALRVVTDRIDAILTPRPL